MPTPIIGGIYLVRDEILTMPPNDRREAHPTRPVVVVSGAEPNADPDWAVVLVCPLSSSTTLKTRFCVKVAAGEANSNKKTWIRVSAIQPMLKEDLGAHTGTLDQDRLEEVQARLIEYLGLADELEDEIAGEQDVDLPSPVDTDDEPEPDEEEDVVASEEYPPV